MAIWLLATTLTAADPRPLAPPDTSSPRATLKSFQDIMGEYGGLLRADIHTKDRASRLRNEILEDKASLCFDLSRIPEERIEDVAADTMVLLQEILDRIEVPPYEGIPDATTVRSEKLSRWTIPYTEITISKVKEGPREGEWLFSEETVARRYEFYTKVEDLPYRPDAVVGPVGPIGGLYRCHILFPRCHSRPNGSTICRPGQRKPSISTNPFGSGWG